MGQFRSNEFRLRLGQALGDRSGNPHMSTAVLAAARRVGAADWRAGLAAGAVGTENPTAQSFARLTSTALSLQTKNLVWVQPAIYRSRSVHPRTQPGRWDPPQCRGAAMNELDGDGEPMGSRWLTAAATRRQ